jgi:site-specific recombinase XerD
MAVTKDCTDQKNQKLQHNPMEEIQDIKSADEVQETIMWLTEEEFEDLLNRVRKTPVKSRGVNLEEKYRRDRVIIYLLTYAGLRVDELSNLKLTDLDMELKRIRILGKTSCDKIVLKLINKIYKGIGQLRAVVDLYYIPKR